MPRKKKKNALHATAPSKKCFWVLDGPILKDIRELRSALQGMADKQFDHHVTKEKNDFATWVEDVLKDSTLAKELRRRRTRSTTFAAINSYIKDA